MSAGGLSRFYCDSVCFRTGGFGDFETERIVAVVFEIRLTTQVR